MKALRNLVFGYKKHVLDFKFDAGTSRGILKQKETFYISVCEKSFPDTIGYGEAGPLPKLSLDDFPDFEQRLIQLISQLNEQDLSLEQIALDDFVSLYIPAKYPSVRFAIETALLDLRNGGQRLIFPSGFTAEHKAIPINGLIWMGDREFMLEQIDQKLKDGYNCIKMKIGAIDFDQECELLGYIRGKFDSSQVTLRVDANGAFSPDDAIEKLNRLAIYDLHSIEQPIKQGQIEAMRQLCEVTPLPIALDEELIGVDDFEAKRMLLEKINPQFIILKPTLVGGLRSCDDWIALAEKMNIGWWITSALESNIGLNAIAQYTATFDPEMPQGLGTGQLYHNNIESPLRIDAGTLIYDRKLKWGM